MPKLLGCGVTAVLALAAVCQVRDRPALWLTPPCTPPPSALTCLNVHFFAVSRQTATALSCIACMMFNTAVDFTKIYHKQPHPSCCWAADCLLPTCLAGYSLGNGIHTERCSSYCTERLANIPWPADFIGPYNPIGACAWGCSDGKVGRAFGSFAYFTVPATKRSVSVKACLIAESSGDTSVGCWHFPFYLAV